MIIRKTKAKPMAVPTAAPVAVEPTPVAAAPVTSPAPVAIEHAEVHAAVPLPRSDEERPMSAAEQVARYMQPSEWAASDAAK